MTGTNLYLTFFAARIDLEDREITWNGAGNPSPLLIRRDNTVEPLVSQNMVIGVVDDCLAQIASDVKTLDPFDTADYILDRVARCQHGPITDDMTLIVAEIK